MKDYLTLLKPRVIWLLILASVAGYVYATGRNPDPGVLAALLLTGVLSTGGAAAFNHYWERDIDALMTRTANRPLPAGRIKPRNALALSLALSAAGLVLAFTLLGPLPAAMVALGWFAYAVVYTVLLKRRSWLNVLLGGVAGNAAFLTGYVTAKPLDARASCSPLRSIYGYLPTSGPWPTPDATTTERQGSPCCPLCCPRRRLWR